VVDESLPRQIRIEYPRAIYHLMSRETGAKRLCWKTAIVHELCHARHLVTSRRYLGAPLEGCFAYG
jgi:hypothetical protein